MRVLAGDVGGTKTSLAVFEVRGNKLDILALEKYPSQEYGSLDEVVRHFVDTRQQEKDLSCDYASFGIAGPVRNGKAETTNLPWVVDAQGLASGIGFRQVWLMNDLEANAWGIGALGGNDFFVLNEGKADANGNASIISAGTGLGQAGLYWDGVRYRPFASEGGHADFAPQSELEIALLQFMQRRYDHVSWERVVSGMGLVNIYEFLREDHRVERPQWLTDEIGRGDGAGAIAKAAQANRCPLCSEALEMFVRLYGAEAGNHALKIMATGGVYLGGGIAPKILDKLREPAFLHAFFSKGRMEAVLREMPVRVILNELTALYGPALFAADLTRGHKQRAHPTP